MQTNGTNLNEEENASDYKGNASSESCYAQP
jgi:hypothetical protein